MSESRVESAAAHSRFGVWCGVLLVAGAAGLLFQTPKSARASETAPAGEPLRFGTADRVLVDSIRTALEPLIAAGAEDGSSLRIDLDEVMGALDPEARRFLDSIQGDVRPGPADGVEFVRLVGQSVRGADGQTTLPVQLLPAVVHEAYQAMSAAMEAELGKRLLVGSGYRSHGYQLFVFASYLSVADYSITETLRHVSLPSEHSQPERQGIDFVSEEGVDLQYTDPQGFQALPEYRWLVANGARFGFAPLPPAESATSPWHWHWEP
jgi:hypothetical protein